MINSTINNHVFRTTDLRFASWLRAKGTPYLRTDWLTGQQAFFVFIQPSEELLLAWQKGDDAVSARSLFEATDFLRDQLRVTREP